jgi:hypothetical protein
MVPAINPSPAEAATPRPWGPRLAWFCFLATSLHLTFLWPMIEVIPGENAKVFSGLWCAVTLVLVLRFHRPRELTWRSPAVIISLALLILTLISSLCSPVRATSMARAFVILAAGLGGYWSARLLLQTPPRQRFFLWFSLGLLLALLLLSLAGLWAHGSIFQFVDDYYHPVISRIILFAYVPIAFLYGPTRRQKALGLALIGVSYLTLVWAGKIHGMGSALLIPVVMILVAAGLQTWSGKQLLLIILVLFLGAATAAHFLRPIIAAKNKYHESVAYRVENLRFSWHLAREHPWFGIGLLAPREPYFKNYQIQYPYLTPEHFSDWTAKLRTSENNFLTFMADLGFPLVLLYTGVLLVVLGRLLGQVCQAPAGAVIPPLALLLPLVAQIVHFQVLDGLFHPQISWFFHILLGLATTSAGSGSPPPGGWRVLAVRFLIFGAVVVGGGALGMMLHR